MVNLSVNINSENTSYPIFIENEEIQQTFNEIKLLLEKRNYLAVVSEKVEKLYGKILNIPREHKFVLKDGEKEKNFKIIKK